MFSRRISAPHELNRLARALAGRTRPYLDLTVTNPTSVGLRSGEVDAFDGATSGRDARVLAALADQRGLVYTPDPKGILSARTAVSNYYAAVHGVLVPPGQIVLAASSSEAYGWLLKLTGDPGDVVLVPAPSYPLLDALAELECLPLRRYALASEDGFAFHAAAVEAEVQRVEASGHRVAAVVLVNPNNPTGTSLALAELGALFALAKERGFAVISDEVFVDYRYSDRPQDVRVAAATTSTSAPDALVFSLGGLSKSAGLPQLKLGWIFANGPAGLLEDALERLEWIADAYLSVSTQVQLALPKLLAHARGTADAIWARVLRNERSLQAAFPPGGGVTVLPVRAGWAACLRVPAVRPEEETVLDLLESHDVLVQPGYFYEFPFEAFVVVSLLPPPGVFEEGLGRLVRALTPHA
ncbi:MAG: pyridoxal phosphate-dependent aminotransferase [Thermoanaerobaculia bacterium]|nr:pyridoxal phosphate-dependent aminotransferase [Thermoanaerobaculia bacterium]